MTIGTFERDGLITGDYPLKAKEVTVHGQGTSGATEFLRGDVVAFDNTGTLVLADSARSAIGADKAVGIICDNIAVPAGESKVTTMFVKGEFNARFLRFGGSDTVNQHKRRMTEIGLLVRETGR